MSDKIIWRFLQWNIQTTINITVDAVFYNYWITSIENYDQDGVKFSLVVQW